MRTIYAFIYITLDTTVALTGPRMSNRRIKIYWDFSYLNWLIDRSFFCISSVDNVGSFFLMQCFFSFSNYVLSNNYGVFQNRMFVVDFILFFRQIIQAKTILYTVHTAENSSEKEATPIPIPIFTRNATNTIWCKRETDRGLPVLHLFRHDTGCCWDALLQKIHRERVSLKDADQHIQRTQVS